jgi:hypothetical protein
MYTQDLLPGTLFHVLLSNPVLLILYLCSWLGDSKVETNVSQLHFIFLELVHYSSLSRDLYGA